MRWYSLPFIMVSAAVIPGRGYPATIHVPADQPSIQAGIDAAADGDTILIADGTHTGEGNRDIDFRGKAVVVKSENGPVNCIVDCEGHEGNQHRAFIFQSGEGNGSILQGLTVRNGFLEQELEEDVGGAIYCAGSSPSIVENIISANYAEEYGAGIYCRNGCPVIMKNIIRGNHTGYWGVAGGGIFCLNSSPAIDGNEISENNSAWGGGIGLDRAFPGVAAVLQGNTIYDNYASSPHDDTGGGGGVLIWLCSPTISNNAIYNNSDGGGDDQYGSGIYCVSGDLRLSGNTISGNDHLGINAIDCSLTLSGNTIALNGGSQVVLDGCASFAATNCIIWRPLYSPIQFSGCIPSITYSDVSDGWLGAGNIDEDPMFMDPVHFDYRLSSSSPCIDAGDPTSPVPRGGACIVDMGAREFFQGKNCHKDVSVGEGMYVPTDYPTIQDAIDASADGDQIIVEPGTYFERIDFTGKAITVRSEQGAAVTIIDGQNDGHVVVFQNGEDSTSVLRGFTIRNGRAGWDELYGGGIYCVGSSPSILDNVITANYAEYGGGGMYCLESSPIIRGNTIEGNTAGEVGPGGGICVTGGSPRVVSNTIRANTGMNGGGISCENAMAMIRGNTIADNVVGVYVFEGCGGGIYCWGPHATITQNTITGNNALGNGGSGGGIYSQADSAAIEGNIISGNEAVDGEGGGIAIACWSCSAAVRNNFIAENIAHTGGGVYCYPSSLLEGNTIVGNAAGAFGGGAWLSTSTLLNNTFSGNISYLKGGGLYTTGVVAVTNTILWGNDSWGGSEAWFGSSSSLTIRYSDVEGGQSAIEGDGILDWQEGMMEQNPLFSDPASDEYSLAAASPCIDAGDPEMPCRPWGGRRLDMGACEYDQGFYWDGEHLILKPIPARIRRGIEGSFR